MECFPDPRDLIHMLIWGKRPQKMIVKGRSAHKKRILEGDWMILLSIRFKAGNSDHVTAR